MRAFEVGARDDKGKVLQSFLSREHVTTGVFALTRW
jgi:hypothetical protein